MNRDDFPLLAKHQEYVYLDSSCVALKPRSVIDAQMAYYEDFTACAGRSHHKLGEKTTTLVEEARKTLAKFLGVKPKQTVFTRNTTEGINLVAHAFDPKVVVISDKEHNSNLIPWLKRSQDKKTELRIAETQDGLLDLDQLEEKAQGADLISVNATSNLDGITNPLKDIKRIAKKSGARLLLDAAQTAGHMPFEADADFVALSGHKMLGPSGTGVLTIKDPEAIGTFMLGGETVKESWHDRFEIEDPPHRFEAGLQDYGGIIGLAEAATYLRRAGLKKVERHAQELNAALTERLPASFSILGGRDPRPRGAVLSVIPQKMGADEFTALLSAQDIFTRSGAFCVHSWFNKHDLPAATRFSFHCYNDESDVEKVAGALGKMKGLL